MFGPTQSGKSAGIAIPNILEWTGPAIVVSIKPDLLDATIAARSQRGEVLVFDPFGLWDQPGHTWSPLASARTWNGALETAQRIASAGEIDTGSVKGGSFWAQAAEQRLAPLLYAAARTGRGMGDAVQWVYGQGGAELDSLMHQLIDQSRGANERADAQQAYDAHLAFTQLAGETRGSIEGTAQILLSAYRSPTVVRSAEGNQITAQRLHNGASTVYLISDSRRSKLLRPILIGLLTELFDGAYEAANDLPERRLPLPLLVCVDELGNAVPIPNLAEIASTAASHNIQLISIFHDIGPSPHPLPRPGAHRHQQPSRPHAPLRRRRHGDPQVLLRPRRRRRGQRPRRPPRSDPPPAARAARPAQADQARARTADLRQPQTGGPATAAVLRRPQAQASRMKPDDEHLHRQDAEQLPPPVGKDNPTPAQHELVLRAG